MRRATRALPLLLSVLALAACRPPQRCLAPPCLVVDRVEGPPEAPLAILCDEDHCMATPAGALREGQAVCGDTVDDAITRRLRRQVEETQNRLRTPERPEYEEW
ncbi:MAG: hypothetical protein AMXMBFR64_53190 [Myxococcales bacterium]